MVNKDEYSNAAVQTADRELEFGSIQFCVQCEPAFHSRVRVRSEGGADIEHAHISAVSSERL